MKLQRLQNRVLCITDIFPRSTPIFDVHMASQIPNVYDYSTCTTKLCRQQAQSIQNHENAHISNRQNSWISNELVP
jgi:hypothetical protein